MDVRRALNNIEKRINSIKLYSPCRKFKKKRMKLKYDL